MPIVWFVKETLSSDLLTLSSFLVPELLYLKGSIPGSKNSEVLVKGSVKNINKLTIGEKLKVVEQAKKIPEKKKK